MIKDNHKETITWTEFIMGKEFNKKVLQYWIGLEKKHKALYTINHISTSYGEEVTMVKGKLGICVSLEDACYTLVQYLKHPMMNGAKKIQFKENNLQNHTYRRGYSVMSQSGITRIVIYELNFIALV